MFLFEFVVRILCMKQNRNAIINQVQCQKQLVYVHLVSIVIIFDLDLVCSCFHPYHNCADADYKHYHNKIHECSRCSCFDVIISYCADI